jgi:hypothetical protein
MNDPDASAAFEVWRAEAEKMERHRRRAQRRREREQTAAESARVMRAVADGQGAEEANHLVAAAIAVDHARIVALLPEMLIEITGMIESQVRDVKVELLDKMVTTLAAIRPAAGPSEPLPDKEFSFARERETGDDSEGKAVELPQFLGRREIN